MTEPSITPGIVGDWALEVAPWNNGVAPTTDAGWTRVRGLQEFTPPAIEKNLEDDSDFDSGAWGSQTATGISWTAEGTVKRPRGTAVDPGQLILEDAGLAILEDGYVHLRMFDKQGGTAKQGVADVTFVENGGPKTDLKTAAVTFTGRGELVDITNPSTASATATAVPIVQGGQVAGVNLVNGGHGYATAPNVTISGDGTGATASAIVSGGKVVYIDITAKGTSYTQAGTTITIAAPA